MVKVNFSNSRFQQYVAMIVEETNKYFDEHWRAAGRRDMLAAFNQVTVFTSVRALQGQEVRDSFTTEFAQLYAGERFASLCSRIDLDAALTPVGMFFPRVQVSALRAVRCAAHYAAH
jgi:cytochrome P450